MRHLPLNHRPDGTCYLHTWRTGKIYYAQNREQTLADWTNLIHSFHPNQPDEDGIPKWDSRRGLPYSDQAFEAICRQLRETAHERIESA